MANSVSAQNYDLVDNLGRVSGQMILQRGSLVVIEANGERIPYGRDTRYDSIDGRFAGYFNFQLQRVLRFPRSGRGGLQIADLDDLAPQFVRSARMVRPARGRLPYTPVIPRGGFVPTVPNYGSGYGAGYAVPYGGGLSYGSAPYGSQVGGYASGAIVIPQRAPQSVLLDSKTIPNPALAPVKLQLFNSGPRQLVVTLVELESDRPTQHKIQPSQAVEVEVKRDAGAKLQQTYQAVTPYGDIATKNIVRDVPAKVLYEVIVHEWQMQSIAIDRTGKSPNVIEDVNYQGKGLGRFPLPAGKQLASGKLDVYRAALAEGNRGAVAPITAREKATGDGLSPLERAVRDLQNR